MLSAARKDDMVEVSIADDGPGISDEAKPHLFDMFYTASQGKADSAPRPGPGAEPVPVYCDGTWRHHIGGRQCPARHRFPFYIAYCRGEPIMVKAKILGGGGRQRHQQSDPNHAGNTELSVPYGKDGLRRAAGRCLLPAGCYYSGPGPARYGRGGDYPEGAQLDATRPSSWSAPAARTRTR